MATWPTPLDQTYDFAALANLRFFEQAVWTRTLDTSPFASAVNAGDDVQLASLYAGWQDTIESFAGSYVPAGYDPASHAPTDPLPTLDLATCLTNAGFTGPSWRRDCRRRVTSGVAASDVEGNPAVAGQLADFSGSVAEYDGATWNDVVDKKADYLSSESASPNSAGHGSVQVGDFIGWWVFAQLKAVMQQLSVTPTAVIDTTPGSNFWVFHTEAPSPVIKDYTSPIYNTNWTDAKNDADANWPGVVPTPFAGALLSQAIGFWDDTPEWSAEPQVIGSPLVMTPNTTLIPATKEIWVGVSAPTQGDVQTLDTTGYAGLTDSAWWKLYATAPGDTSATITSSEFPDTTKQPPWGADPTSTSPDTQRTVDNGFVVTSLFAVFRWDFGDFA